MLPFRKRPPKRPGFGEIWVAGATLDQGALTEATLEDWRGRRTHVVPCRAHAIPRRAAATTWCLDCGHVAEAHDRCPERPPEGIDACPCSIEQKKLRTAWVRPEHPEDSCHWCGGPNVKPWFTENDTWNLVMPDSGGILCPQCFTDIYRIATGERPIWRLSVDRPPPADLREGVERVLAAYPAAHPDLIADRLALMLQDLTTKEP